VGGEIDRHAVDAKEKKFVPIRPKEEGLALPGGWLNGGEKKFLAGKKESVQVQRKGRSAPVLKGTPSSSLGDT